MLICMMGLGDGRAKFIHVLAGLLSFPVVPTFPEAVITHQICKVNWYKSIVLHIEILEGSESWKTMMRVSGPDDSIGNLLALIPHLFL